METTNPPAPPVAPVPSVTLVPPVPSPRPLAPGDPRLPLARAVALCRAAIAAVRPDQLGDPTPCEGFDVRTLLSHLVAVLGRVAALGEGKPAMSVPDRAAEPSDGDWAAAFLAAAHRVQEAWTDDAVLGRTVQVPWGDVPAVAALGAYTSEVTVHTWDLAQATGQQPAWDEEVIAVALGAMERALPADGRVAMFEAARAAMPPGWEPPFGAAVAVADDAPSIDRLVGWTGRRPR